MAWTWAMRPNIWALQHSSSQQDKFQLPAPVKTGFIHLDILHLFVRIPFQRNLFGILFCITSEWQSHSHDGLKGHLVWLSLEARLGEITCRRSWWPMTGCQDLKLGLLTFSRVFSLLSYSISLRTKNAEAYVQCNALSENMRRPQRSLLLTHWRFLLLLFAR